MKGLQIVIYDFITVNKSFINALLTVTIKHILLLICKALINNLVTINAVNNNCKVALKDHAGSLAIQFSI